MMLQRNTPRSAAMRAVATREAEIETRGAFLGSFLSGNGVPYPEFDQRALIVTMAGRMEWSRTEFAIVKPRLSDCPTSSSRGQQSSNFRHRPRALHGFPLTKPPQTPI